MKDVYYWILYIFHFPFDNWKESRYILINLYFHMTKRKTTILSEKYFADVMLLLLDNDNVICADIENIVSSALSRTNLVKRMRQEGLIKVVEVEKPRKTYFISLTDYGENVAKSVKHSYNVLNNLQN